MSVAPFVGAWIEICSKPLYVSVAFVAPFVGAWIEIPNFTSAAPESFGRSLRGSVD